MKKHCFGLILSVFFISCTTQKPSLSPQEVMIMTTRQFNYDYELVFRSIISLLQSEGFIIEKVEKEVGLVHGYKRIQNDKANTQRFWLGYSEDAKLVKQMYYIEPLNANSTEVRLSIYAGSEVTQVRSIGANNKEKYETMIYDSHIYAEWFVRLREEMERRESIN